MFLNKLDLSLYLMRMLLMHIKDNSILYSVAEGLGFKNKGTYHNINSKNSNRVCTFCRGS